jgi:hypothetical protein
MAMAAVGLAGLGMGCGERAIAPRELVPSLALELSLSSPSGDPDRPLEVSAVATNHYRRTVYHFASCWAGPIRFEVFDSTGRSLLWYDPSILPACADACCVPLEPGGSVNGAFRFGGLVFAEQGESFAAPTGDYTVVAVFEANLEPRGEPPIVVTRRARFHWTAR